MAETDDDLSLEEEGSGGKKINSKKIIIFVVLPLLLLIIIGAAVFLLQDVLFGPPPEEEEEIIEDEVETTVPVPGYFYEIPPMLVNLQSGEGRAVFLKIGVTLDVETEVTEEILEAIESNTPRIMDHFQVYLRELRPEDVSRGSAGIYRMREELLRRVNLSLHPIQVRNVLFREVLVQ